MKNIPRRPGSGPLILGAVALLAAVGLGTVTAHDEPGARPHHIDVPASPTAVMRAFTRGKLDDGLGVQSLPAAGATACAGGFADGYPCDGIDLGAFLPLADMGATQSNDEANDIWGWTDPQTGREYAIVGRVFGTSFVDVTDPAAPIFVGELDTRGRFGSPWRDVKVHADHAFIVSEARRHGMQVFDLTRLRGYTGTPILFAESAHYRGFGSAHNIVINEETGYAYAVGTDQCAGGLEIVDVRDPLNPRDAGCYAGDGYTHDAQCVVYRGTDAAHHGKEICFASNEDTLTIVDVTDKGAPVELSRTGYAGAEYTHQGWLTEDQSHFLLDDELDEQNLGTTTRTHLWNVEDLDAPMLVTTYEAATAAIDHNQYVRGSCSFQANYRAGLRVLGIDTASANAPLEEIGFFDIYPADDAAEFNAAWSNYPYFDSGTVVVSGIEQGLFVLRPSAALLDSCGIGGTSGTAPSVAIDQPAAGATVSGEVAIAATASDPDQDDGTLSVTWRIDDGAAMPMNSAGNGAYTASWDSAGVADGDHTLTVGVTDDDGNTASTERVVRVKNDVVVGTAHLHELIGSSEPAGRGGKWIATVSATVYDDGDESVVENATVSGEWGGGASGTGTCVTGGNGSCTFDPQTINRNAGTATFTVTGVSHPTLSYAPDDNHDAGDGSVTVMRP